MPIIGGSSQFSLVALLLFVSLITLFNHIEPERSVPGDRTYFADSSHLRSKCAS